MSNNQNITVQVQENNEFISIQISEDTSPVQSVNGKNGWVVIDKNDVGLSNVENISIVGVSGSLQNQIDQLDSGYASQLEFNILSGNLNATGINLKSDISNLSGYSNNTFATAAALAQTGSTLDVKINNLSGSSNNTFATITNLQLTGVALQTNINTVTSNLFITGATLNSKIDFLSTVYATINSLRATGATLQTRIDNLSGYSNNTFSTITNLSQTGGALQSGVNAVASNLSTTGAILFTNLNNTGVTLDNKINSLSGAAVLKFGDQDIGGTKYFNDAVYIHDLYVTGTEFIATVQNNFIETPFLLLNLTGGVTDGGIFFVTGSGLTGINDLGPIIGFDHSDKFKFGISSRGADLSTLNDIAAVQDILAYSGHINSPESNIVFTSGIQELNGLKIFKNTIKLDSKDPFEYFDQPKIILSDSAIITSPGLQAALEYRYLMLGVNIDNTGNNADTFKVFSGEASPAIRLEAGPAPYATRHGIMIVNYTNSDPSSINEFDNFILIDMEDSGSSSYGSIKIGKNFPFYRGVYTPVEDGIRVEVDGGVKATNLVYNTGGQIISGVKNFASRPTVNGTGVLLSGEAAQVNLSSTVQITGDQTVSGIKNFISRPTYNGTGLLIPSDISNLELTISGIVEISGDIVYATGDQTISGVKNFASRPTVNGTGVLLSGEAAQLPDTIVYTTGNQTITGTKTFASPIILSRNQGAVFLGTGADDTYGMFTLSTNGGNAEQANQSGLSFVAGGIERFRIFKSGHIAFDDYFNLPGAVSNSKYKVIHFSSNEEYSNSMFSMASRNLHTIFFGNQSGQFILGTEARRDFTNTGDPRFFTWSGNRQYGWLFKSDLTYSNSDIFNGGKTVFFVDGVTGILSGASGFFIDKSGASSLDWNNRILSGQWKTNQRLLVNGTGVLLSGEAAQVNLSSTVQITGDQTISGVKNFASRPTVNGTGVTLSGEVIASNTQGITGASPLSNIIQITQSGYDALVSNNLINSSTLYVVI